jgi:2-hydroxychromene-2-carboxylate isomerase
MAPVTFYFDLGSPYAYLAAERLDRVLPEPVEWTPVLLGGLFRLAGRGSWALDGDESRRAGIAEVELRARRYGLPPLRWPDRWPADYLFAMRAATHAFAAGRGREFTLQAFRDAFWEGVDLSVRAHVLNAAQTAGLDRRALETGAEDRAIKDRLREATDAAFARGVIGVPSLWVEGEVFWGDDRLEDAAPHLTTRS